MFINKDVNEDYKYCQIPNKFLILGADNINGIHTGKWIVFTDCQSLDLIELSNKRDYNFAMLKINNFSNAKIAASLGLSKDNKVVKIKKGVVFDGVSNTNGCRNIKNDISFLEVIDFIVYYMSLDLKENITNNNSVEKLVESIVYSIFI